MIKEGVKQETKLFENTIKFLTSFTYQSSKLITDCSIGYTYFSTIEPKTHILPHCGPCNLKLRVHLPISLPQDDSACWISVGNERKTWKEGEMMVFDDSFVHEVKNDSSEERVVLVFDIWHPDLFPSEIEQLQQFPL
uniref:Aspartyl/asparaginy/proline hydroxylase domain-containing protein n=1 Tax=Arcella intermedia TaxID=1963864 RepID=A0A6B2LM84_9EUKA